MTMSRNHQQPDELGLTERLPPGRGGRLLKPGERPKTPYDPFGGTPSSGPTGRGAQRRYADDLSGFRPMPEVACPNPTCGGIVGRRFSALNKGAFVPKHELRCESKCGFEGVIKGKVLPLLASGEKPKPGYAPTKAEMVAGFKLHIDKMWKEKTKEINLVDSLA
jgi:hypothetical protein